jgi:hypothetical protein
MESAGAEEGRSGDGWKRDLGALEGPLVLGDFGECMLCDEDGEGTYVLLAGTSLKRERERKCVDTSSWHFGQMMS